MIDDAATAAIDCLLFTHRGRNWLAPASLVAEVVPHFAQQAPDTLHWCGELLACHGEEGPVRALMVLRDITDDAHGFHALALADLPHPRPVLAAQLQRDDDGLVRLDGQQVELYCAAPAAPRSTAAEADT